MSPRNAEAVREIYAALNRREDPRAILQDFAEGFVWYPNPEDPEQAPRRGFDEVRAAIRDLQVGLEGLQTDVEDVIEGGDCVVVALLHRAPLPGSKSSVERREAHLWTFEGNKVVRLAEFPTVEAALEDAGLAG